MKKIILLLTTFVSLTFATTIHFNGVDVTLNSNGLKVGDNAPVFTATTINFQDMSIGGRSNKVQIIAFIPSLDTGTCELQTIAFNNNISKMENVALFVVSKDLPFAQHKFCKSNKITNITVLSDYKDANNALRYGTTISAPAFLEGFFGRVVYIIDTKGKIAYVQVVKELANEPDYNDILNALRNIK